MWAAAGESGEKGREGVLLAPRTAGAGRPALPGTPWRVRRESRREDHPGRCGFMKLNSGGAV